jgi:hypothetical protein
MVKTGNSRQDAKIAKESKWFENYELKLLVRDEKLSPRRQDRQAKQVI